MAPRSPASHAHTLTRSLVALGRANAILGNALDDFVGSVLSKKSDSAFFNAVDKEFMDTEIRALKEKLKQYEDDGVSSGQNRSERLGTLSKQKEDQKDIFQVCADE